MCITDGYDMTLAVKVALNPTTTNQLNAVDFKFTELVDDVVLRYSQNACLNHW